MSVEATCHGERFQFLLRLEAQERPGASGPDGEWWTASVGIQVAGGAMLGPVPVAVLEGEIRVFQSQLVQLNQTLSGTASLQHSESRFGIEISLSAGRGAMSGCIREPAGMTLRFENVALDQTFVRQTLREFTGLIATFDAGPNAG